MQFVSILVIWARNDETEIMPDVWAKEVALEATSRRILASMCERVDFGGPGDVMHFEQMGDVTSTRDGPGAELGAGDNIIDFNTPTITEFNLQPFMAYAATQIDREVMNRMLPATEKAIQKRLGISNGNQVEITVATDTVAGWSNAALGSSTADPPTLDNILDAIGTIWNVGGDLVNRGDDRLFAVFHPIKWDDIIEIGIGSGTFLSASVRGEAGGVAKTGILGTVFGAQFDFTGHILTAAGTGTRNIFFTEGSVLLGMKEEPQIIIQPFDLTTKIIAIIDYGVLVFWPSLGIEYALDDEVP